MSPTTLDEILVRYARRGVSYAIIAGRVGIGDSFGPSLDIAAGESEVTWLRVEFAGHGWTRRIEGGPYGRLDGLRDALCNIWPLIPEAGT